MKNTKIEWTQKVWNPSVGCTKISEGCKCCYAEIFANRLKAIGLKEYKNGFKFTILPDRLYEPLRIKKPSIFFVNSMSDLFHEKMPKYFLDSVFDIINKTPYHIYQILTKRPQNMYEYLKNKIIPDNVCIGVTVECEKYKYRIDILRKINAKVRFISFEPLIDRINNLNLKGIDWVIVGGESGPKARPIKKEWVLGIYNEAKKENIPFFFKQWGTWGEDGIKRSKKLNGAILNGREYKDYPKSISLQYI